VFLSGVAADLGALVTATFGLGTADAANGAVELAEEVWTRGDGGAIGTGPVLAGDDAAWTTTRTARIAIAGRAAPPASKHDEIAALREALRTGSERLRSDLETPPEWSRIGELATTQPAAVAAVLTDVAHVRTLVGRYLLDAADYFDDERIDQLGDGYVRVAQSWREAADRPDFAMGQDILALEEACAGWMSRAAEPPTRYAF
jgi:hypothetical protein